MRNVLKLFFNPTSCRDFQLSDDPVIFAHGFYKIDEPLLSSSDLPHVIWLSVIEIERVGKFQRMTRWILVVSAYYHDSAACLVRGMV